MRVQGKNENVAGRSLKRSFYSVAMAKYFTVFVGIAFSAVMSRLLSPEDFGIFAVVNVIDAFLLTVSDFGIGAGIIQDLKLSDKDINGIFTFTGMIGVGLGMLIAVLGIPLSIYYQTDVYLMLCPLLFFSNLFFALNIAPNAVMLREGRYGQIAVRNVAVSMASLLVGLLMAFLGCKYYALAGRTIAMYLSYFLWNEMTVKLKFSSSLKSSFLSVKKIASYSVFQFLGDTAYYGELNMDNFLIGARLGSTSLAYYDKAYRLLDYPVGNLAGTLNTVLHPMLKDFQDQKQVMFQKHLYIQKVFSLISMMLVTGCFLCSREMIDLLYGPQWEGAVMTFSIMSFAVYPKMMLSTINTVFSSLGDTKLLFRTQIKRLIVVLMAVIAGAFCGNIEAVALAVVISSWINFFMASAILVKKGFGMPVRKVFREFVPDIVFMVIAVAFLYLVFGAMLPAMGVFQSFVVKGVCVAVIYVAYYVTGGGGRVLLTLVPVGIRNRFR